MARFVDNLFFKAIDARHRKEDNGEEDWLFFFFFFFFCLIFFLFFFLSLLFGVEQNGARQTKLEKFGRI